MESTDKEDKAPKVTRHKLVENSKAKFYANITKNYTDNKDAPILKASTKPTKPAKDIIQMNKDRLAAKSKDLGSMRQGSASGLARKPSATMTKSTVTNKTRMSNADLEEQKVAKPSARVPSRGPTPLTKTKPAMNPRNQFLAGQKRLNPSASMPSTKPEVKMTKSLSKPFMMKAKPENGILQVDKPSVRQSAIEKATGLAQAQIETQVAARIQKNEAILANLCMMDPPPLYAKSLLQSARYNKYKVTEAHLSVLDSDARLKIVDQAEESTGRTPLMFSAYYGCQDAIEILVASQAKVQIYDKKGRTCLHYAALNDSARQIETIFLIAKASPAELSAPTNFEKVDEDKEESKKNQGAIDEKYDGMNQQMDALDHLFTQAMPEDKEAKSPRKKKCLFVNHQDKLGRTALHTAVAFGNRIAVETLLYLGCNPHAKDFWGQRPLDMCFGNETLGQLLENRMAQYKQGYEPQAADIKNMSSLDKLKHTKSGNQFTQRPSAEAKYPLDIKDVKLYPKEKIIKERIGSTNDNYLMYAIKHKRQDLVAFLLRSAPEISLIDQNNNGQSALHLAILSDNLAIVKALFIGDMKDEEATLALLETQTLEDIKGNMTSQAVKMLKAVNLRGLTPLLQSVDHGNYSVFRFIFEVYVHIQRTAGKKYPILSETFIVQDKEKEETALMRAVRLNKLEMVFSMLHMVGPDAPLNSVNFINQVDKAGRNILHLAVMGKQKDLVEMFVQKLDCDTQPLRRKKDSKGKVPAQYDEKNQFSHLFITKWDAAGSGANMKLQKMIDAQGVEKVLKDQTFWLGNTVMHMAARYSNLAAIKMLMPYSTGKLKGFELEKNRAGKSPLEYAQSHSKDVNVLTTIEGLLQKLHTSTKVIKNAEIKQEKNDRKNKADREVQDLKDNLKRVLRQKGLDLANVFKKFDKNNDGYFSQMEFECAFTVLEIDFKKADLRKLISASDSDKDGRISHSEFCHMLDNDLNAKQAIDEDAIQEVSEYESDESPQKQSFGSKAKKGGFSLENDD